MFAEMSVGLNRGTYGGVVAVIPSDEAKFRGDVSFTMNADYSQFVLFPDTIVCE